MLDLHDKMGRFVAPTEAEISAAGLTPEQESVLQLVIAATANRDACTEWVDQSTAAVREAMATEATCFEADRAASPPKDRIDCLREVIASYDTHQRGIEAPETASKSGSHAKHAVVGPRIALANAVADLANKRDLMIAETAALKRAELTLGSCLSELLRVWPRPSQEDVFRQKIEAETAAKLARIEQGLPPAETKASPYDASPISQSFAARGKGGRRTNKYPRPAHAR